MIMRRHRYSDAGAGTSVNEVHPKALTAQQFERCASLISALEVMRKSDEPSALHLDHFDLVCGWAETLARIDYITCDGNPGAVQLFQSI